MYQYIYVFDFSWFIMIWQDKSWVDDSLYINVKFSVVYHAIAEVISHRFHQIPFLCPKFELVKLLAL